MAVEEALHFFTLSDPVPRALTGAFYEMVSGQAGDWEPGTPSPPFVLP